MSLVSGWFWKTGLLSGIFSDLSDSLIYLWFIRLNSGKWQRRSVTESFKSFTLDRQATKRQKAKTWGVISTLLPPNPLHSDQEVDLLWQKNGTVQEWWMTGLQARKTSPKSRRWSQGNCPALKWLSNRTGSERWYRSAVEPIQMHQAVKAKLKGKFCDVLAYEPWNVDKVKISNFDVHGISWDSIRVKITNSKDLFINFGKWQDKRYVC